MLFLFSDFWVYNLIYDFQFGGMMNNVCFMKTPAGVVRIVDDGEFLLELDFAEHACGCCLGALASPIGMEVKKQLKEYFDGERKKFDLPLKFSGTDFQMRVWNALLDIPYGETRSYIEVARAAGSPKGARAAGQAVHVNPIGIIVPCHRVIAADGTIGGFAAGTEVKTAILQVEGIVF